MLLVTIMVYSSFICLPLKYTEAPLLIHPETLNVRITITIRFNTFETFVQIS